MERHSGPELGDKKEANREKAWCDIGLAEIRYTWGFAYGVSLGDTKHSLGMNHSAFHTLEDRS